VRHQQGFGAKASFFNGTAPTVDVKFTAGQHLFLAFGIRVFEGLG
jgi:hypothetical protein